MTADTVATIVQLFAGIASTILIILLYPLFKSFREYIDAIDIKKLKEYFQEIENQQEKVISKNKEIIKSQEENIHKLEIELEKRLTSIEAEMQNAVEDHNNIKETVELLSTIISRDKKSETLELKNPEIIKSENKTEES